MTIDKHIASLRAFIQQYSDDSQFSDEFLANLLYEARAVLLSQKVNKGHFLGTQERQSLCMIMEVGNYKDCDCIPTGIQCDLVKSSHNVPSYLTFRSRSSIKVRTIGGDLISYKDPAQATYLKYSRALKDKPFWYIDNKKLLIWNNNTLKAVVIEGIFEYPPDLSKYNYCSSDGTLTSVSCYDARTDEFPLRSNLVLPMFQLSLDILRIPMSIDQDETNDAEFQRTQV